MLRSSKREKTEKVLQRVYLLWAPVYAVTPVYQPLHVLIKWVVQAVAHEDVLQYRSFSGPKEMNSSLRHWTYNEYTGQESWCFWEDGTAPVLVCCFYHVLFHPHYFSVFLSHKFIPGMIIYPYLSRRQRKSNISLQARNHWGRRHRTGIIQLVRMSVR